MKILKVLGRVFLLAAFAMWFGGFGFYASIVVPTGNEVLGSFQQATVTRQVTHALNIFAAISLVAILVELFVGWSERSGRFNAVQSLWTLAMLAALAFLCWLHPQIDSQVDLDNGEVAGDYQEFYFRHRCYLWGITLQWIAAWGWLVGYVWDSSRTRNERNRKV